MPLHRRIVVAAFAVALLVLTSCGGVGAESPEQLFSDVQALTTKREWSRIWELYTPQERKRVAFSYASFKEFLQKNPAEVNRKRCRDVYGLSPEEFYPLQPYEIFAIDCDRHAGDVDIATARIDSVEPAPDLEGAMRVLWSTRDGTQFQMLTIQIDGRWRLVTMRE